MVITGCVLLLPYRTEYPQEINPAKRLIQA